MYGTASLTMALFYLQLKVRYPHQLSKR